MLNDRKGYSSNISICNITIFNVYEKLKIFIDNNKICIYIIHIDTTFLKCINKWGFIMGSEDKKSRFKRVAQTRTQKVLDMMELLGNCSNKNNYEYEEEDVKKIMKALDDELSILKKKFESNISKNEKFKL